MFHLIFDGVRAVNQVGFLLGGLVLLGIGLAIVGHEIYWRVHAQRVDGVLTGVRTRDGFYYSVYRYVLPATGASVEATSSTGSNSLRGRVTGTAMRLMVMPSNPEHAEPANSWLVFVLGVIFALPGLLFLWIALRFSPITTMTWVMLGVFAALGAFRIKKLLRAPSSLSAAGPSISQWNADRMAQRRADLQAIPVVPAEQIQDAPKTSVFAARSNQLAGNRSTANPATVGAFLLLFGSILFGVGGWMGVKTTHMMTAAVRAPGVVIRMEGVGRSSSKQSYRAIVRFVTAEGQAVLFRDKIATRPALYDGGEAVVVLYLPEDPQGSAMIDHGIWKWLIPGVLMVLGGLMLIGGKRLVWDSPPPSAPLQAQPDQEAGPITRL